MSHYAATSDDAVIYPVLDDANKTYAVIVAENKRTQESVWILMMARVVSDTIVIEEDNSLEKRLVGALMVNGGIARDKIVLAYKGEKAAPVE